MLIQHDFFTVPVLMDLLWCVCFFFLFSLNDLKGSYAQYNFGVGLYLRELAFLCNGLGFMTIPLSQVHLVCNGCFLSFLKGFLPVINHFSPATTVLLQISIQLRMLRAKNYCGDVCSSFLFFYLVTRRLPRIQN